MLVQARTILVVDNDPNVLQAVETYLVDLEYHVVKASVWTEAIAEIEENLPDAILLDLHLPTVQGEALLEFIRQTHATLPVVIISTDISPPEMTRLSQLGASGFIRKPFETDDLFLVLEQVLTDISTLQSPSETQIEQPTASFEQPSIDTLFSKSVKEPIEELVEESIEESVKDSVEDSIEDSIEDSVEDSDKEPIKEPAAETPPPRTMAPLPVGIVPGSGVQDLARHPKHALTPVTGLTGSNIKRVRKKKKQRSKSKNPLKKARNFALILLFFVLIAGLIYTMQQGLNLGFLGGITFGNPVSTPPTP